MLSDIPAQTDDRVLVDFRTADDAGVFKWESGPALVQTVDFFTPIVDDPYDFGRIAATNALSDVYAMGGRPLTALAIVVVVTFALLFARVATANSCASAASATDRIVIAITVSMSEKPVLPGFSAIHLDFAKAIHHNVFRLGFPAQRDRGAPAFASREEG